MSGVVNSVGGFLGLSGGPQAPTPQTGNNGLQTLNDENNIYDNDYWGPLAQTQLASVAEGSEDPNQAISNFQSTGAGTTDGGAMLQAFQNQLATGATTGSQYAAQQIGNNATQNSLYGANGQLGNTENLINQEQNQGYNLQPQDQSLYGQEAGQIANQYGQQGNQAAQALASRGLSNSGAAGATFSGISGNQNQMLANAMQGIAQQRFQNTQNQIAQNQNYAAQLGGQYNTALNNQYGRQLAGAQNQTGQLEGASGQQTGANNSNNQANMAASMFNVANTPANIGDFASAGMGAFTQASMGGAAANNMNNAYRAGGAGTGA